MRVRVHRKDCRRNTGFHIRDLNMKVIGWQSELVLVNCKMVVNLQERREILAGVREPIALPHAWIEGDLSEEAVGSTRNKKEITYRPKEGSVFFYKYTNVPIFDAEKVYFNRFGVFVD